LSAYASTKYVLLKPIGIQKIFARKLIKEFPNKQWKRQNWTTFSEIALIYNWFDWM